MPIPLAAKGAVVAVSVAVATAIAIYESPELRRYADDVRRRIALALHSIGDGINPPYREPLYNRPEDSEGFLQSRTGPGAEPGVDADEESRRRQREELLYWNSIRLQKEQEKKETEQEKEPSPTRAIEGRPRGATRGSSFDDFLRPDGSEQGAFVFNTGTDVRAEHDGLRRRGDVAQPRAVVAPLYTNPFADEHHLDSDEVEKLAASNIAPGRDEIMSDIYSATTRDAEEPRPSHFENPVPLIDLAPEPMSPAEQTPSNTETSATLERELPDDEFVTAGQDDRHEAYASIQAWAQDSSRDFYSPLPVTPSVVMSEPELISDGELTPTDSVSLVGSGEDIANEAMSQDNDDRRPYDVMSESEGMATPASWSEVSSEISEADIPLRA